MAELVSPHEYAKSDCFLKSDQFSIIYAFIMPNVICIDFVF
jgi:hypothetical protein